MYFNTRAVSSQTVNTQILQLFGCIYMAVECYNFHLAPLRWFHDAVYTLWEFVTWVQFPIFIFFHLLSAKFKVNDPSWTRMVIVYAEYGFCMQFCKNNCVGVVHCGGASVPHMYGHTMHTNVDPYFSHWHNGKRLGKGFRIAGQGWSSA